MARRIRFCGAKPYEDVMKQMALSLRNGVDGGVSKLSIDRNRKYLDVLAHAMQILISASH